MYATATVQAPPLLSLPDSWKDDTMYATATVQAPVAPVAANETFGSCNASSGSAASAGPLFAGNDQPVLMLAFSVVLISVFGHLLGHSMARRRWRIELNRHVVLHSILSLLRVCAFWRA